MRHCRKCGLTYDDASKICRACGAILDESPAPSAAAPTAPVRAAESSHEPPPAATERVPLDAIRTGLAPTRPTAVADEQGDWPCASCGELVPPNFDQCWKCGAHRDGRTVAQAPKRAAEALGFRDESPAAEDDELVAAPAARRCPACGSSSIIPRVTVLDSGEGSPGELRAVVYGNPEALLFKDRLYGTLTATVCGQCGHAQMHVDNAPELYAHYRRSLEE